MRFSICETHEHLCLLNTGSRQIADTGDVLSTVRQPALNFLVKTCEGLVNA